MIFTIQTDDEVAGLDIINALDRAGIKHTLLSKQHDTAAQQSVQADALESCDNNHHYIKGDDPSVCSCGKPVRR